MTLRFSKKEILILILAVILMIAIIFSGYYFYLDPKKQDIEIKAATLKSEQQVLAALQQKQQETTGLMVESVAALQRKVPVKPLLEQIIFDLEKAEVVSGSQIKNMSFTEADVPGVEQPAPEQPAADQTNNNGENSDSKQESEEQSEQNNDTNTQQAEQTNQQTDPNQQAAGEPASEGQYQPSPLPAGIKKLTVSLQVVSTNYEELRKFIEALESLPRTVVVESVSFASTGEVTDLDSKNEEQLSYSLTLSAFYMPALTDLQEKLPELVPPEPGNKTNPFNRFPDVSPSEVSN